MPNKSNENSHWKKLPVLTEVVDKTPIKIPVLTEEVSRKAAPLPLQPNGHGDCATPKNETRDARFSLPNPPPESEKLLAGYPEEGANESLREFHVKEIQPVDTSQSVLISFTAEQCLHFNNSLATKISALFHDRFSGHTEWTQFQNALPDLIRTQLVESATGGLGIISSSFDKPIIGTTQKHKISESTEIGRAHV